MNDKRLHIFMKSFVFLAIPDRAGSHAGMEGIRQLGDGVLLVPDRFPDQDVD